jgi:hypothetical protein
MIRYGVALAMLGVLWPSDPRWAYWFGSALCFIGGAVIAAGVRRRRRP